MTEKKFVSVDTKIRKGQALNMAVSAAVAVKKPKDTKYILEMAMYYENVITIYQESTPEELVQILKEA